MSDNIKAMLMQAMQDATRENEREERTLTAEQQATRLKDILAHLDEAYEFERGDLIIHKFPNMCMYKTEDHPGLFLGYLDQPVDYSHKIDDPTSAMSAKVYDCRIGFVLSGKFVVYLMDSSEFRPIEQE